MIESIISLILAIVVRILIGWLSLTYSFLQSWIVWFNVLCIVLAFVSAAMIVCKIVSNVRKQ